MHDNKNEVLPAARPHDCSIRGCPNKLHAESYACSLNTLYLLSNFYRDVLTIGKRLARERDEMCRELRRLHESTLELHDKMIMEVGHNDHIVQACHSLHERWQQQTRQWYTNR